MLILIIINIRETVYYVTSLVSFNYVRLDSHGFQQLMSFILQPTCVEWTSKKKYKVQKYLGQSDTLFRNPLLLSPCRNPSRIADRLALTYIISCEANKSIKYMKKTCGFLLIGILSQN